MLEAYLGGQAVGGAVVNVLYGNANPSGQLAETFPLRIRIVLYDLFLRQVQVESETVLPKVYTLNSTMGEIMADPKEKAILEQAMGEMEGMDGESTEEQMQDDSGVINDEMMAAMMEAMPLRQMLSFVPGVTKEALNQLVAAINAAE